ncbi:helix-turn-helix domain-containing protein [Chitinophagaceae bacterium MMS25-I14]
MLTLNLHRLMNDKGISSPNTFLVKAGFTYYTASRIISGKVRTISYDHLEQLCLALNCTLNDLFDWQAPKDMIQADMHPLAQLKPRVVQEHDLNETIRSLPLDKLGELHTFINQLGEEKQNSDQ